MNKLKKIINEYSVPFAFWCTASVACYAMKSYEPCNETSNCGKTYPIDYIIYTNLFCEIK